MLKRTSSKSLNQSQVSILVEQLVLAIQQLDKPVSHQKPWLKFYLDHIEQMLGLFDGNHEYDYNAYLQLFREAVQDVGVNLGPFGLDSYDEDTDRPRDADETLSALVQRIWVLTRQQRYRRMQVVQRYQARKQERELRDYADGLFERYARLLVVRVDLYYRSEAQARLRVEHVVRDIGNLLRARRSNEIFDHEIGYICGVEQGHCDGLDRDGDRDNPRGRGFHAHVAFFFNGDKVRGDIYKAQQVGELWEEVTRGRGSYNNCNRNKEEKYGDRLGIGMIHRDDRVLRDNLYLAMDYLVKDDQHLRLRPLGRRSLRRGKTVLE